MSGHPNSQVAATGADFEITHFASLASLRAAHSELLKRHRESDEDPEFLIAVDNFVRQGRATGLILDADNDRWAAQSTLDYWSTLLYRANGNPPDATLADFNREFVPELASVVCPYPGLDAFQQNDHRLFYGRRQLTNYLVRRLDENHLLALVGPKGSGPAAARPQP